MNGPLQGKIWDAELKRPQRELLLLLSWYANSDGGNIYPSLATLAHKLDYDERHVRRLMRGLESAGYIQRTDPKLTRKRTYVYRIVESTLKPKGGAPESATFRGTFSKPGHSEPSTRTFCCTPPDISVRNPDIQMSPELEVERAKEIDKNAEQIWNEALKQIKPRIDRHRFETWVKPIRPVGVQDERFVFGVPHPDYVEMCEQFKPVFVEELVNVGMAVSDVRFFVR